MNAKTVLSKIVSLLSTEEVKLAYAKLKDGTVVESETFDVGEDLFIIGEDGNKTPAPDGEHELSLKDREGDDVLIKVISKDGKIVERENVELADADEETVKAEPLPGDETKEEKMEEETKEEEEMEEDGKEIEIELGEMVRKLSYRIEEMEKKISKMEEIKEEVKEEVKEEMEEELPKLDGAPIEAKAKFSSNNVNFGKKIMSTQESVLARLYK